MAPAPTATAIVAEDEAVLREALCEQLLQLWPSLHIVAQADNGLDALRLTAQHQPDVLFLDIQMPGLGGLDVARRLEGRALLVFVTAYDAHAVEAFERGAVDYVLKPWTAARLAESLRRIQERVGQPRRDIGGMLAELAAAIRPSTHLRWVNASAGQEVRIVAVDEICYFRAESKYTVVVTANEELLMRRALKEVAAGLDPSQFWQVHRSTVVNARAIAGVARSLAGQLRIRLRGRPELLAVSAAHEHLFRSM